MAGGPLPPQNIEAEQSVLGSLLLDTDAVLKISPFLLSQDFYQESHRQIYQAILDLHEKRQPSDLVTLTDELERRDQLDGIGGAAYLASLTNAVPSPVHVEHYGHIVERIAVLRRLIAASGEIAGMAYEESEDVDQIIDHAEEIIFGVAQRRIDRDLTPLAKHLEEYYDYIEQVSGQKGEIMGLPTGYDDLDKLLAGLQKSDLVIVAGRPGMGKTSLALSIASYVAREWNARVALFSLEMPAQQLAARLICAATDRNSRVDTLKLRSGKLTEHQLREVVRAMGDLSQHEIYIDDSATLTPMELRAKARRLHAEKPLDLIIVDYLQLMGAGIRAENRVREVSFISQQLKALARELRVPVLACSQLSRAVELRHDKRPVLSDLRESGCLAGETLITRADTGERIPIKDLAEREEQAPIPVFALDERYRLVVRPMTRVFPSGRKRVYQLHTRSGRTIRASANHPFRTIDGWQALENLSPGSRIALPRHLEAERPENSLSNSELALLAHLLGDGCTVPRQPIHYTSADEENIRIVERAANRLFNIEPRRVRQKNWWHVYLPSPYRLTHGRHNPISQWLIDLGVGLRHAWKKRVPDAVFRCDQLKIRFFLHHLWATDGNISWKRIKGRKPSAAIYYATTSSRLASDVQQLLIRVGIHSTLRVVSSEKYRDTHQVHIQGQESQVRFLETVNSAGQRGRIVPELLLALAQLRTNPNTDTIPKDAWGGLITGEKERAGMTWRQVHAGIDTAYCGSTLFKSGLSRARMARVATALGSERLQDLAESDLFWDEIASIESLGVEEVYDATVPGVHNFVANDLFVHNSIEQDADVVIFIYREVVDQEEAERANVADVIVAKHRNGPTGQIQLVFLKDRVQFVSAELRRVAA